MTFLGATPPKQLSPLALAFVGDGVYELLVREYVMAQGNASAHTLHMKAVQFVKAAAQSEAVEAVLPLLTEEELAIYKRGRNAHSATIPKNANPAQYRKATGLEALFGYLHLENRTERVRELFQSVVSAIYVDKESG